MLVKVRDLRLGMAGTVLTGLGRRLDGNLTLSDVRVCFWQRPCQITGSILVFKSQLR